MQPVRFADMTRRLVDDLDLASIVEILTPLVEKPSEHPKAAGSFHAKLYHAKAELHRLRTQEPNAFQLAEDFGLTEAFSDPITTHIVSQTAAGVGKGVRTDTKLLQFYFRVGTFLAMAAALREHLLYNRLPEQQPNLDTLTLEIDQSGDAQISTYRLEEVLKAIRLMYEAVSRVLNGGVGTADVTIALIESGSNIKLSVEGGAEVIRELKAIVADSINGIRFWRFRGRDRQLETFRRELEALGTIADLVDRRALTVEEAARMKHTLVEGAVTLVSNGAAPTELHRPIDAEVRGLLSEARASRLLGPGGNEGLPPDATEAE